MSQSRRLMRLVGRRKPASVTVLEGYRLGQRLLCAGQASA